MSAVTAPASDTRRGSRNGTSRRPVVLGYLALAALAYVPVLASSPGKVAADTKQYLYLDPGHLLSRAVSMWDPHVGMGTVTHQTIGYVFPMGPYYWVLDKLAVPDWVAQRIWLGSLLFGAAVGVLYLLRTFGLRGPGVVVAAVAYMLTPYTLDYSARISVLLMPWAALPWMIGVVRKGLRDGGWRYPAIFAVIVQVVGGVNATALIFALVGPALWVLYAWLVAHETDVRRVVSLTLRTGLLTFLTSLWWIAGLRMQGAYGLDILKFTETVQAVARTSTPNEVLRGLGYWFFYGQDRLGPWIEAATDYTQRPLVILAGYGLVALSLLAAGLVRWRARVFFVALTFAGVVIAVGAYPYSAPSPLGALFKAFANSSSAGLALRSTARAVPLVVLGLSILLGLGVNAAHERLRANGHSVMAWAAIGAVLVVVVANFPALFDGNFYGKNLERAENVPGYWTQAASYLDKQGDSTRVLELPGADFASYTWGNTVDPITPGLMDRPYVARELIPYGTAGSADLLNALDRRIQEGITDPKGVTAVLKRMGVGDVVLRNDIQYERYDVVPTPALDRLFTKIPGLGAPTSFGPPTSENPAPVYQDETSLEAPPNAAPSSPVQVYPVDGAVPIVRAESASHDLMVSGDGEGLIDASDVGLLDGAGAIRYSASYPSASELRSAVDDSTVLVVTDQNRLRARRWTSVLDNLGETDAPGRTVLTSDPGDARLDLFPGESDSAMTITEQHGVKSVTSTSYGNTITYTPEDRASQALDGDPTTAWRAAAFGNAIGQKIRIELDAPITTDHVNLVQPINGGRDRYITGVTMTFDGGTPVHAALDGTSRTVAGQTLTFPRRTFRTLEISISNVNTPERRLLGTADAVGFAEIRLRDEHSSSDVHVAEVIRMPDDLLSALGSSAATHPLVLVMSRDRLQPAPPRTDPEQSIVRAFTLPGARTFTLTGSGSVSPDASDASIDRALGVPDSNAGGVTASSSEFLVGCVACRADAAIDGNPATAWQTPFVGVRGQWIDAQVSKPITFDHIDLQVIADGRHSVPTRVRLDVDGSERELAVPPIADQPAQNATTTVRLSFPAVTGRDVRLTIDDVREEYAKRFGDPNSSSLEPVAVAELGVPGLKSHAAPTTVDDACRSDLLTIDGHPFPVRVTGASSAATNLAGLTITPCDPRNPARVPTIALGPGRHVVASARGKDTGIAVDRLVLASNAHDAALTASGGRVTGLGRTAPAAPKVTVTHNGATKMRVHVEGATPNQPFWLVLGESQSAGWRADVVGGSGVAGHALGGSTMVDGYANGWLVKPSSASFDVSMEWVPQRTVWLSLYVSAIVGLVCLMIIAVTGWRRRGTLDLVTAPDPHDADVDLAWPFEPRNEPGTVGPAVGRRWRWLTPVFVGLLGTVVAGPWAGLVAAALVVAVVLRPALRGPVVLLPAALLATCGIYIVYLQRRYRFPAVFEWPTLFPRATALAWIALLLLAADACWEVLSTRARRSRRADDHH